MYTVDANGNKIPMNTNNTVEPFVHQPVRENFTMKKSTMKWLYWALGAIIVLILAFVIIRYLMKPKSANVSIDSSGEKADQRFGFRFY